MNELQIFQNPEFGTVRTVEMDGEPWLVGKDVAEALGYKDTVNALKSHVEDEDKARWQITTQFGIKETTIINESGLYSLVLSSKLPTAKKFRRWVTGEVLPSIRKTGGYIAGQEQLSDTDLMARALLVAKKQIDDRNQQIAEMAPKAVFADAVSASKSNILIGELAKLLRQNGIEMGQNRLFEWMRKNGYLINRDSTDRNMPTQRAMEMGLFVVKETAVTHSDGHVSVSKTPKVTGKGQVYFINKFKSA